MAVRDIQILREVITKLAPMLAGKGFRVTQRGMDAYVHSDETGKPILVNLPYIPDDASEDLILAIQGFLDHEVAHILLTDWAYPRIAREADKKAGFKAKSAMEQGPRAWCQNVIEDTFIEREMGKLFPGSVHNLEKLHRFFIRKLTVPQLEAAKDDSQRFRVLIIPLMRALSGQVAFQDWLTEIGFWDGPLAKAFIAKFPQSAKDKLPEVKNSKEAWEIAQTLHDILFPPPPPPPPAPPQPEQSDDDQQEGDPDQDGEGEGKKAGKGKSSGEEKEGDETSADPDDSDGEPQDDKGSKGNREAEDEEGEGGEPEASDDAGDPEERDNADADGADGDSDAGDDEAADGEDAGDQDGKDRDADSGDEDADDGEAGSRGEDEGEEEEAPAGDGPDDDDEAESEDEGSSGRQDSGDDPASEADGDADEGDGNPEGDDAEGEPDDETGSGAQEPGAGEEKSDEGEVEGEATLPSQSRPTDDNELPLFDRLPDDLTDALKMEIHDEALRAAADADYIIYTKDFDRIEPYAVDETAYKSKWLVALEERVRGMIGVMQKEIERMMAARSQVLNVPGYKSGRLHSAGLHRLSTGDDRVFRRRIVNHSKSTAVELLIDNSGSMHGAPMKLAMETGYALAQTLERVGIPHEVIGFTTSYYMQPAGPNGTYTKAQEAEIKRVNDDIQEQTKKMGRYYSRVESIYMPIYKGFDDRLTPDVKKRFVDAANRQTFLASNLDGECVENAVLRLMPRREERKVLLVLSDGYPAGSGGAADQYSKLHKSVAFAKKVGVECIGIGIMSNAVKTFYPQHVILNDLDALPATVMGKLKEILLA